jgi:hypothetical protein
MAVIGVNVVGDIGGTGISRFHVKRSDNTAPTIPDCNAAAAAIKNLFTAWGTYGPTGVSWQFPPQVPQVEETSAELQGYLNLSSIPTNVTGVNATAYPAGNGLRIDWLTATIRNRRLMRASNFIVPLAGNGYATTGQVASACQSALLTAASNMMTALATASLVLVAYHRPPKGTFTGGLSAPVTAYRIPVVPATLRSRRT